MALINAGERVNEEMRKKRLVSPPPHLANPKWSVRVSSHRPVTALHSLMDLSALQLHNRPSASCDRRQTDRQTVRQTGRQADRARTSKLERVEGTGIVQSVNYNRAKAIHSERVHG